MKSKRSIVWICILLIAGMLLPVLPASRTAALEINASTTYEQYLAEYYINLSSLDFLLNQEGLPYHTYVDTATDDFKGQIATWRIATMGASDLATYTTKEVDFYVLLIYDIVYQKAFRDSELNNFLTSKDATLFATTMELSKQVTEAAEPFLPDLKITDDNYLEILNKICATDAVNITSSSVLKVLSGLKFAGTVEDLMEKLCIIKEFQNCSDELASILEDIHDSTSNKMLKDACKQVLSATSGLLTEAELIDIVNGQFLVDRVEGYVLDKLWDAVVGTSPVGIGAMIGQTVGKLASEVWTSTDTTVESWYSMEKVYKFDKVLAKLVKSYMSSYKNNPTQENAELFNAAAEMYMSTLSVGMDYAINYVDSVLDSGLYGLIYQSNAANKEFYEKTIRSLTNIRKNIDWQVEFVNNETYNMYLEAMEEVSTLVIPWNETPCEVTEEQLVENEESMAEFLFNLTNQTVDTDTTYAKDRETYANFTLDSGTLDLGAQTLTVYGDFYLNGGTLKVNIGTLNIHGNLYMNGGTLQLNTGTVIVGGNLHQAGGTVLVSKGSLDIAGDYRIQRTSTNSAGETIWVGSGGVLRMEYDEGTVSVGGDFITQSSNQGTFSAGTLKVGGDFSLIKYSSSSNSYFCANGTHKVILNGKGPQTVKLYHSSSYFSTLEIQNSNGVVLEGCFKATTLTTTQDVAKVTSNNVIVCGFALVDDVLSITGDVYMNSNTIALQTGTLKIDGNLIQSGGTIEIQKGTLEVTGDYRIQTKSTNDLGELVWNSSGGVLRMALEEGTVLVKGNFITNSTRSTRYSGDSGYIYNYLNAGTMYIGGDFRQLGRYSNFAASGTHKVVLKGTEPQTISLEYYDNIFATLEIQNSSGIILEGYFSATTVTTTLEEAKITSNNVIVCGFALVDDVLSITGDVYMNSNTIALQTGTLKIDGNLTQSGGTIEIQKGTLEMTGDYRIQTQSTNDLGEVVWGSSSGRLRMTTDEGTVIVGSDFITGSDKTTSSTKDYNYFRAGTLYIGGNFKQYNTSTNFQASGTHKVVLNGKALQNVTFASSNSYFNILQLDQFRSQYTFSREKCWNTLIENGKEPLIITGQQVVNSVYYGQKASVVLTAGGEGLTYQWWIAENGSDNFRKSSITSADYTVTMSSDVNGRRVYCVIMDTYGETIQSDTITLTMLSDLEIVELPVDVSAAPGKTAAATVVAAGDGLTYEWWIRANGNSDFTASSCRDSVFSVAMSEENDGLEAYCVVVDAYGSRIKTNVITMKLAETINILTQPQGVTLNAGKTAVFTVEATGNSLTYQWQYRTSTGGQWQNEDSTTNTLKVTVSSSVDGYEYRCVITDADGNTKTSAVAKLTCVAVPTISKLESTSTGIKLTWDPIPGAAKYRVYVKSGNGWKALGAVSGTSYTYTGVKPGQSYTFTIRCVDAENKKATSDYNKTGWSHKYYPMPSITKLESTTDGVKITWGKIAGAEKYRIYVKSGSSWKALGAVTGTSYTWTGAKAGTTYTFTIRCVNADNTKATSNYNTTGWSHKYYPTPEITKLESASNGVKITWDAINGTAKYRVYVKTETGWKKLTDTTATSYTWTGAEKGKTYTFTVRCLASDGKTYLSNYNTSGWSYTYK